MPEDGADGGRTPDADDEATEADESGTGQYEMIPLEEWDRLRDALERFCRGRVRESDDRIECRTGSATFAVTRDGTVEAGMPLHEFGGQRVDALGFDPRDRSILVEGRGIEYVFRQP